jgi:DNA-binding transcriptional regulator YhcF (GntR family)
MAAKKKKTTKTTKSVSSPKPIKSIAKSKPKQEEKVYSYRELAELLGISKLQARAYFNMCQIDYDKKITIKEARELFKKF